MAKNLLSKIKNIGFAGVLAIGSYLMNTSSTISEERSFIDQYYNLIDQGLLPDVECRSFNEVFPPLWCKSLIKGRSKNEGLSVDVAVSNHIKVKNIVLKLNDPQKECNHTLRYTSPLHEKFDDSKHPDGLGSISKSNIPEEDTKCNLSLWYFETGITRDRILSILKDGSTSNSQGNYQGASAKGKFKN